MSFFDRSDGSVDSRSSYLMPYYCTDCDARHDLGFDATLYVCDSNCGFTNPNLNFDNTNVNRDYPITRVSPAYLAHYQIYAIDPATGQDIPDGDDVEASNSNQISITQAEWDTA